MTRTATNARAAAGAIGFAITLAGCASDGPVSESWREPTEGPAYVSPRGARVLDGGYVVEGAGYEVAGYWISTEDRDCR